jgi:hypothetical protein
MVGQLATIKNTSTGWLRVRQAPGGAEVGKVYPGESYVVLDTSAGWLQILLEDGTGWVSGTYTTIGY